MTLKEIIAIADAAYPDGLVGRYFEWPAHEGDTLAEFVVFELKDTFEESLSDVDQLKRAADAMGCAIRELQDVVQALRAAAIKKGEQDG